MKIEIKLDDLTTMVYTAHQEGSAIRGHHSIPCSLCRAILEQGGDINIDDFVLIRDHFHGGDFNVCARKLFRTMTEGKIDGGGVVGFNFLLDGHLHESSMLNNIEAGLPDGCKIVIYGNQSETIKDVLGWKLVTHCDGAIVDKKNNYIALLECKAVKPKYFKEIKDNKEIRDEWYGQGQAYLFAEEEKIILFIIKNREDSKIMYPIRVDVDMGYVAKRLNVLNDIHHRIKNNLGQPDREHTNPKDFECQFCPYNKECWND